MTKEEKLDFSLKFMIKQAKKEAEKEGKELTQEEEKGIEEEFAKDDVSPIFLELLESYESELVPGTILERLTKLVEEKNLRDKWIFDAKADAGYTQNTTFEYIWTQVLSKARLYDELITKKTIQE